MSGAVLNGIATALDGSTDQVNWVLSGWAIAATVSVTAIGKLSDIFGRRWLMLIGNAFVLLGSVGATPVFSCRSF